MERPAIERMIDDLAKELEFTPYMDDLQDLLAYVLNLEKENEELREEVSRINRCVQLNNEILPDDLRLTGIPWRQWR